MFAASVAAWTYTNPTEPTINYQTGFQMGNTSMNSTDIISDNFRTTRGNNLSNIERSVGYTIYKPWYLLGTLIVAENGSTGKWDYTGTNDTTLIQSVINAQPAGTIFIKSGNYTVNLKLLAGTYIKGETTKYTQKTILIQSGNSPAIYTDASATTIDKIFLDGLYIKKSATAGYTNPVINLLDTAYTTIQNSQIDGYMIAKKQSASTSWLMYLKDSQIRGYFDNKMTDSLVDGTSFSDITDASIPYLLRVSFSSRVANSYFWSGWNIPGIVVNGSSARSIIINNQFDQLASPAIKLEDTGYSGNNKVIGNLFYQNKCDAIIISSTGNSIIGNDFTQTGYGSTAYTCGDINLTIGAAQESKQNTITGNSFYSAPAVGTLYMVKEDGTANVNDNIIVGNSMRTYGYNYSVHTTGLSSTTARSIAYNGNAAANLQQVVLLTTKPTTLTAGIMFYNTTSYTTNCYDGSAWRYCGNGTAI